MVTLKKIQKSVWILWFTLIKVKSILILFWKIILEFLVHNEFSRVISFYIFIYFFIFYFSVKNLVE